MLDFIAFEKEKCYYCDKSFQLPSELKQHVTRAHINPFLASQKPNEKNSSTTSSNVTVLKSENSGSKLKYTCEICMKSFRNAYRRKIHTLSDHEQKFDYECQKCQKLFCLKPQLLNHNRKVHKVGLLSCEHCNKKLWNTKERLQAHINR